MYANGDGVPKDTTESYKWFRKAAEQGDVLSQFWLGLIYATGADVPKDFVQGHAWLNIASAQGHEGAKKALANLEEQMTPEQKAEAMNMARALFEKLSKK